MTSVKLIDVDSTIPNLALMKASAFHKSNGDEVGFDIEDPDVVIASIVFRKNAFRANEIKAQYSDAYVSVGGPGYSLQKRLADVIEHQKPDYDLYPSTYAQGFTTRGCVRDCSFCIVRKKEGVLTRWHHPEKFYDDRFDTIMFQDNNWIADKPWFLETSQWTIDAGLKVIECGIDIRLVDEEIAQRLTEIRFPKGIHFAFDDSSLEPIVRSKCEMMENIGLNLRRNAVFYVYCHDSQNINDAARRCRILKEIGTNAFVMYNIDKPRTKKAKHLQHWANRRQFYWACDFKEFNWKSLAYRRAQNLRNRNPASRG